MMTACESLSSCVRSLTAWLLCSRVTGNSTHLLRVRHMHRTYFTTIKISLHRTADSSRSKEMKIPHMRVRRRMESLLPRREHFMFALDTQTTCCLGHILLNVRNRTLETGAIICPLRPRTNLLRAMQLEILRCVHIHAYAGSHRSRQRNLFQVRAFGSGGLGFDERVHQCRKILQKLLFRKTGFADNAVNSAGLVGLEFN